MNDDEDVRHVIGQLRLQVEEMTGAVEMLSGRVTTAEATMLNMPGRAEMNNMHHAVQQWQKDAEQEFLKATARHDGLTAQLNQYQGEESSQLQDLAVMLKQMQATDQQTAERITILEDRIRHYAEQHPGQHHSTSPGDSGHGGGGYNPGGGDDGRGGSGCNPGDNSGNGNSGYNPGGNGNGGSGHNPGGNSNGGSGCNPGGNGNGGSGYHPGGSSGSGGSGYNPGHNGNGGGGYNPGGSGGWNR